MHFIHLKILPIPQKLEINFHTHLKVRGNDGKFESYAMVLSETSTFKN